jgi:hypothetical protein
VRRISRKGNIIFIIFLVVGVTLLSVGVYFFIRGGSLGFGAGFGVGMLGYGFLVFGGLLTILDLLGGLILLVRSRRKE